MRELITLSRQLATLTKSQLTILLRIYGKQFAQMHTEQTGASQSKTLNFIDLAQYLSNYSVKKALIPLTISEITELTNLYKAADTKNLSAVNTATATPQNKSAWVYNALDLTGQTNMLLYALTEFRAKTTAKNKLNAHSAKHLAALTQIDAEKIIEIAAIAHAAQLITVDKHQNVTVANLDAWLQLTPAAKILHMQHAAFANLNSKQITALLRKTINSKTDSLKTQDITDTSYTVLNTLGITTPSKTAAPYTINKLFTDSQENPDTQNNNCAEKQLAQLLPQLTGQIIAQPDMTLIAPAPLKPETEILLWQISKPEMLGVASTFRITENTIMGALQAGLTKTQIVATLEKISITGTPQTIEFLLAESATKINPVHSRENMQKPSGQNPNLSVTHDESLLSFAQARTLAETLSAQPKTNWITDALRIAAKNCTPVLLTLENGKHSHDKIFTPKAVSADRVRLFSPQQQTEITVPITAVKNIELDTNPLG